MCVIVLFVFRTYLYPVYIYRVLSVNKGLQLRINYHVEHGLGDVVTVQFVKHLAQVKIPNRRADVVDPVRFRRVVDLPQQQHITYTRCPIEEKRAVSGSSPIKEASRNVRAVD